MAYQPTIRLLIDPNMENQDIWNIYISKTNLKRKYLLVEGVYTAIELSPDTLSIIAQKKKETVRRCFDRYHDKHREKYNEFYRLKYHDTVKDGSFRPQSYRSENYNQEYYVKNNEKIRKYQEEYRQRKREEAKLLKEKPEK